METISLKLPPLLQSRLDAEARRRQVSKSKLVRDCLDQMLVQKISAVTCHDLAADLAGSLRGPRDLATNPKYLKRFGR